jgi:predicted enzyme related to lactoylglutathione lyase
MSESRPRPKEYLMSYVTGNQPDGTPTWIDLGIPDLERAMEFYRALFGWEFDVGSEEVGRYTMCLLRGRPVAALMPNHDPDAMAIAKDPGGAQFGLWQGRAHIGCQIVNEPDSLVRNDLVTPVPEPTRDFYSTVFGYTLDRNEDLADFDFTFLRRPDGHEIGGILGLPDASSAAWQTTFEVADADAVVERAIAAGGSSGAPSDTPYGRSAEITDPFGTEFSVIARPADERS